MAEPARENWYVTASESVLPDIIRLLGLPKVMIENRVEPAKTEPATAETATVEPATAEPAKVEPAKGEPAKVKPAKAEPARPLEGLESLLLASHSSHSSHAVLLKWQWEHLTHYGRPSGSSQIPLCSTVLEAVIGFQNKSNPAIAALASS